MADQDVQVEETLTAEEETLLAARRETELRQGDSSRETPAEALHKEIEKIDQKLQTLGDPVADDEPDPRTILPGVTSAVEALAKLKFGDGVVRVVYSLSPQWSQKVTVDVYGDIKTTLDAEDPDAEPTAMEAEHLGRLEIEGKPTNRIGDAALALQKKVGQYLKGLIYQKQGDIVTLNTALKWLEASDGEDANLVGMWPTSDPDDSEEGDRSTLVAEEP